VGEDEKNHDENRYWVSFVLEGSEDLSEPEGRVPQDPERMKLTQCLKIQWIDRIIDYNGSQLTPHWIYRHWNLVGNAMVAFIGSCDVKPENMVDLADYKDGNRIASARMLHFIAEFFDRNLTETILLQRLFVSLVQQEIVYRTKTPTLIRAGNDLYDGELKLSVSIATASPVSTLMHYGINISSVNTPIKTKGLEDYGIDPKGMAHALLETMKNESETLEVARAKVKPVGGINGW
jgi:hypothetical protein